MKFTPKGGRVYVRMQREDSHVEIVVADTGAGIEPAFLPHVFQPFRQQDATITRTHGGLGLGLAIVKHLVELHGGTIEAQSDGAGKGATFVVRLPVSPLRSASLAAAGSSRARTRSDRARRCAARPSSRGFACWCARTSPTRASCSSRSSPGARRPSSLAGSVTEALDRFAEAVARRAHQRHRHARRVGLRAHPPDPGAAAGEGRPRARRGAHRVRLDGRPDARTDGGIPDHVAKPTEPQELLAVVAALVGRHARTGPNRGGPPSTRPAGATQTPIGNEAVA